MITLARQDHPGLSMVHLCELHGISRSWYYEQSAHPEQTTQEIVLLDRIEDIVLGFPGYGYRRVTHELARQGWTINLANKKLSTQCHFFPPVHHNPSGDRKPHGSTPCC